MSPGAHSDRTRLGLLWISPWIVGTLVFLVAPVAMSVYYSLTDYSLLEPPVPVGLANYAEIAHDRLFWISLKNTAIYALFSVILGSALAVAIAVLLEQRLRGSNLVRAIVFLPTLVPIVAASIGWMWLYSGEYGLFNAALRAVGLIAGGVGGGGEGGGGGVPPWVGGGGGGGGPGGGPDWLGDVRLAMPSLIVMGLWSIGSSVVINTAALREVPRSLYDAAAIDGMGPLARFRSVTLPMISPAIAFNAVVSAVWSLQVFAAPLIMTKGGPEDATLVYSMYVFRNAFEYGRMGYASALAWIQFALTLIVTGAMLWIARRVVHSRGGT